jgi:glucose-1-phosphate cytidylyltransferase
LKTVILCGGFGTRIRDVADSIPKPMIPIGTMPILWHIMKYYAEFGHKEFVLCLGYKSEAVKDFFVNYHNRATDFTLCFGGEKSKFVYHSDCEIDWRVTLAETGLNTMTGGRVRAIEKYVGDDENFMLTYGDGVGNVDIDALLKFHRSHGKILTVTGVHPPGRFGELAADANGCATEFNEKPQTTGGRINGGFFVCRREIFRYLAGGDGLVFEQEPIRALVKDREMMVFNHDGFWQPMDTNREFSLLNELYAKGKAPWVIWK